MKKIVLIMLATLLLGVLPSTVSAGIDTVQTFGYVISPGMAKVNAAINKSEGVLNAYSVNNGNEKVKEQVFAALTDLSSSLKVLNASVKEIYPDLNEKQQLAVQNRVVDIIKALQVLATETNSVFGKEVMKITIVKEESIDKDGDGCYMPSVDFLDITSDS